MLRANDPVAAHVVEYWASCYVADKALHHSPTDPRAFHLTDKQQAKHNEALDLANRMRVWMHLQAQRGAPATAEERDVDRMADGSPVPPVTRATRSG